MLTLVSLCLVSNWNRQLLTVIKQNIKLVLIKGLIKLDKIATNRNLNLFIAKTILCFISLAGQE